MVQDFSAFWGLPCQVIPRKDLQSQCIALASLALYSNGRNCVECLGYRTPVVCRSPTYLQARPCVWRTYKFLIHKIADVCQILWNKKKLNRRTGWDENGGSHEDPTCRGMGSPQSAGILETLCLLVHTGVKADLASAKCDLLDDFVIFPYAALQETTK